MKKTNGQNTKRTFGRWRDHFELCSSRAFSNEFTPEQCQYGEKCRFEHDLRKYLAEGKRENLKTFEGKCPVWEAKGVCNAGWKCRFIEAHSEEREISDGKKELVLITKTDAQNKSLPLRPQDEASDVINIVKPQQRAELAKKKRDFSRSDSYIQWLEKRSKAYAEDNENDINHRHEEAEESVHYGNATSNCNGGISSSKLAKGDNRAQYIEPPFLPSEKRRIYYGPETPILAPLTTQGNLPFRRLCVDLGAQVTWSEMALGMNLIKGEKGEWALLRAHSSEMKPPTIWQTSSQPSLFSSPYPSLAAATSMGYDNATDVKFGAQIAANKPYIALKTTEVLSSLCPRLRAIDLNCGCPIDMVYRQGAGSALLDAPSKLERMLRGMNALSGEIPITLKIRTGTKDNHPTAQRLVERLVLGSEQSRARGEGPPGIAAITLHGRSRQQRYTKTADWSYIAECAALIKRLGVRADEVSDTAAEVDPRDLPNNHSSSTSSNSSNSPVYFIGNGDCYSPQSYRSSLVDSGVNSVMIARGALLKPWIFEEVSPLTNPGGQDMDKSASERLGYVEKFVRYGLDVWGSDEVGVGTTRRFLLEWLSFAYRYVPVGLLEVLPPRLNERPPPFKGRNELETLLASADYRDWIKIRLVQLFVSWLATTTVMYYL